jgi:hypothetical protein
MILVLVYLVGGVLWFCFAGGLFSYEPWLVTAAFIVLGVRCIFDGLERLAKS